MGFSLALGSLLVLLFMLGVVLALAVFGLAWAGRRRAVRRSSCGSCGYAVAGLEGMRCPECGADLREAGIVTPDQGGIVPRVMLAVMLGLAWTMLLPFPAMVVTKLLVDSRPRNYVQSSTYGLASPRGGFDEIVIELHGEGPNQVLRAYSRAEIREVSGRGTPDRVLHVALPEMRLTGDAGDADGAGGADDVDGDGEKLDVAFLADWLGQADQGRTAADLTMAANEIMKHLRSGMQRGGIAISSPAIYTSGQSSATSMTQPLPGWVIPSLIAPWILIWLGLLLVVLRAYRRGRKRASAAA